MAEDNDIKYTDAQLSEHDRRAKKADKANAKLPDPREEAAEPEPAAEAAPPAPTGSERRGRRRH